MSGLEGLKEVIGQLEGVETFQGVLERDVLRSRIADYAPSFLDELCASGQVIWRRFGAKTFRRGQIGFGLAEHEDWLVPGPDEGTVTMELKRADQDIVAECDAVREFLSEHSPASFEEIVRGTEMDERYALRAIWYLVWAGEATNTSFEPIRYADITSGLSGCYDLFKTPERGGITIEYIVKHMLEYRKLYPTYGKWRPTERLLSRKEKLDPSEVMKQRALLLLNRYGVLSKEMVTKEALSYSWRDLRAALKRLELMGAIRRGFFVEELSGEQYAIPEALEALRLAKLRHAENGNGEEAREEPRLLVNACDPAFLLGAPLPLTDERGEAVKFMRMPQRYFVVQKGRPLLIYHVSSGITLLANLSKEEVEQAMRTLMQLVDDPPPVGGYPEVPVANWNDYPIDVSPARFMLLKLGFIPTAVRWKGFVYDGSQEVEEKAKAEAEARIPDFFEQAGIEKAPVEYNEEWILSRASDLIRPKLKELFSVLREILPEGCEFLYRARDWGISYKGFRCIHASIQQNKISLMITPGGWAPPLSIEPDADLNDPELRKEILEQFEHMCERLDLGA